MRDRLDLLLGVADAAGDDRAADGLEAGLENVGARREVIRKAVDGDVAGADASGEYGSTRAVHIAFHALEFEDRSRRHQDPFGLPWRECIEAAEGRIGFLQRDQIGLAQQRQLRQSLAGGDLRRIDARKVLRIAWRLHRIGDDGGQTLVNGTGAGFRIARFQIVEIWGGHDASR